MLLDKPEWVQHGDGSAPIFSVDVHPESNRLASAGGDGTVVLWSVNYMFSKLRARKNKKETTTTTADSNKENDEPSEEDFKEIDRIATLFDHKEKPVNVARFSNSGRFIASGGDNHLVLIHELRPLSSSIGFGSGGSGGFGSSRVKNLENWTLSITLTGHSNNVVDLGWSPDDSMVASCSLDNTVRIWDTLRGTLITVLQEHTSFVKGVVWDPVGKYLASQSDDRSVVIRTVEGWETASVVKEPFVKAVWNTFSTRLDWCPDGSHITAVNTYQSPKNTAAILMRGSWSRTHDYIGHKGPVVASRFSPRLFRVESDDVPGQKYVASCIALGAQDNKVTVWLSRKARPVLVAKTFFKQSVVDLCWSPDGLTLFAASIDGSIAMFSFEEKELGERLSVREVQDIMKQSYGRHSGMGNGGIAEDPALMGLMEGSAGGDLQMEEADQNDDRHGNPFGNQSNTNKSSKSPRKSPSTPSPLKKKMMMKMTKKNQNPPPVYHNNKDAPTVIQHEIRNSDGRRRIAPVPMGHQGAIVTTSPLKKKSQAASMAPQGNGVHAASNGLGAKRKAEHANVSQKKVNYTAQRQAEAPSTSYVRHPAVSAAAASAVVTIPKPTYRPRFSLKVGENATLEVQNVEREGISGMPTLASTWCEVMCMKDKKRLWMDKHLGTKVQIASGCEDYVAVGLNKGILQVYSKAGRRMWPQLTLGSQISFLQLKRVPVDDKEGLGEGERDHTDKSGQGQIPSRTSILLLACTCFGKLWVWNVEKQKCMLTSSLCPIAEAEGASTILSVRFSEAGMPLVVLDTKVALCYSPSFQSWLRVADGSHLHSEYNTHLMNSLNSTDLTGLNADAASKAQSGSQGFIAKSLLATSAAEVRRATGRHLEFLSHAAAAMKDSKEYCNWLAKLCRYLAVESEETKLREICEEFLGKLGSPDTFLLGMPKRKILLKIILPAIASVRSMQRLASEYIDLTNNL